MTFIKAEQCLGHSVIYTDEAGQHFRYYGGTFAWRNHNPIVQVYKVSRVRKDKKLMSDIPIDSQYANQVKDFFFEHWHF